MKNSFSKIAAMAAGLFFSLAVFGQKSQWFGVVGPSVAALANAEKGQKPSFSAHFGAFWGDKKGIYAVGGLLEHRHFYINSYTGSHASPSGTVGVFELFYLKSPAQFSARIAPKIRFGIELCPSFLLASFKKYGREAVSPAELSLGCFFRFEGAKRFFDLHFFSTLHKPIQNGIYESTRVIGGRFSYSFLWKKSTASEKVLRVLTPKKH